MILVTGATGTVGRLVLETLPAALSVRALTRDPARLTTTRADLDVAQADYDEPTALRRALTGVHRALLVTTRIAGNDDEAFVNAARDAGVHHIVKLSAAAVTDDLAHDLITDWQRNSEATLTSSGLNWTLLRPRSFMSNALTWAPTIRSRNLIQAMYTHSPNACIHPRDIAEVAVRTLTEDGHHHQAYTLTGPKAVTAHEQSEHLAHVLGRPLRCEELHPHQARTTLLKRYPHPIVTALLESAQRQHAGAKAHLTDTVHTLTGHTPRPFHTWAHENKTAFTPTPQPNPPHTHHQEQHQGQGQRDDQGQRQRQHRRQEPRRQHD